MNKKIYKIVTLILGGIIGACIYSCDKQNEIKPINFETTKVMSQLRVKDMKKWAEERKLQQAQDESDKAYNERVAKMYDAYWKSIRDYKKSDHKLVYGWFGGWTATEGIKKSFLSNLPDSVDVVSIWGGVEDFDENDPRFADLKYAQEVKGLKVLLCWQTGTSGLGLPGGVYEFNNRHAGKTTEEKAREYAKELTAFIKKHNLNGYDIDWEPHVGDHRGCGNLYQDCDGTSSNNEAPIRAFITEMGKTFGPKATENYNPRGTGTMFLFDGELADMGSRFPEMGVYFDYFLTQNYGEKVRMPSYQVRAIKGFENKKYIMCDEFEKNVTDGGICGGSNGKVCAECKADNVVAYGFGGWGAYHIELEEAFDYRYVRSVTQIMNPTPYYVPNN